MTVVESRERDNKRAEMRHHLRPARLVAEPLYDPAGERIRG